MDSDPKANLNNPSQSSIQDMLAGEVKKAGQNLSDSYTALTGTGGNYEAKNEPQKAAENKSDYGFKQALNPLNTGLGEMYRDLGYSNIFPDWVPGGKYAKKALTVGSALGGTVMAEAVATWPHELVHAATLKATGGEIDYIGASKSFGGDIIHSIVPQIKSEDLSSGTLAQVVPAAYGPWPTKDLVYLAPVALEMALGYYLLSRGKTKKSLLPTIAGAGLTINSAEQIFFTDYSRPGTDIALTVASKLTGSDIGKYLAEGMQNGSINPIEVIVPAFLIGIYTMGTTYKLSKATVNKVRKWRNKKGENILEATQSNYQSQLANQTHPPAENFGEMNNPGS